MTNANTKTNKRRAGNNSTNENIRSYIKIQLLSLSVYITAFLIMCGICLFSDSSDKFDMYFSLFAVAAASFISGFLGGNKTRKNGILSGLICASPSNLIVILISLITVDFKPDIRLLITALVLILTSVAGGITAVNSHYRR